MGGCYYFEKIASGRSALPQLENRFKLACENRGGFACRGSTAVNGKSLLFKTLVVLPVLLATLGRLAFGSCSDTVWNVAGTGTTAFNTTALNSFIGSSACSSTVAMTIH